LPELATLLLYTYISCLVKFVVGFHDENCVFLKISPVALAQTTRNTEARRICGVCCACFISFFPVSKNNPHRPYQVRLSNKAYSVKPSDTQRRCVGVVSRHRDAQWGKN